MADPFQAKQAAKPTSASAATPALRDMASAKPAQECPPGLLRPRDPRIGRAVKLLDVLTSGDEVLLAYLKEHGAQALQSVEDAKADMAEAETPEEAEDFRPDPMDELVAQMAVVAQVVEAPPIPVVSPGDGGSGGANAPALDLQSLRDALMAECQSTIAALALPQANPAANVLEPEVELNLVNNDMRAAWGKLSAPPTPELLLAECAIPGCCIHSVTLHGGEIIHHYEPHELNTPALRMANKVLHGPGAPDYVEVYGDSRIIAVDSRGNPTQYNV